MLESVEVNGVTFEVGRNDFWQHFNQGAWEPHTREFYRKYAHPFKDVIDIGAWIGPTVLWGYANNARRVIAVEADVANFHALKANCIRNYLMEKVDLHNVCIYNKTGDVVNFDFVDPNFRETSVKAVSKTGVKVPTIRLEDFLKARDMKNTSIVKIDIEGGEQFIAEGLKYIAKFKNVNVLLSFHTPFFEDKDGVFAELAPALSCFRIFLEDDVTLVSLSQLKTWFLDESETHYAGKRGLFFTVICKTI